jgi:UDPglucose 6-dehydrogenase
VRGAAEAVSWPGHLPSVVFLCVSTQMDVEDAVDLTAVQATVSAVREVLSAGCALVIKSTVPVGLAAGVRSTLQRKDIPVVCNPGLLREGCAVTDFLRPDRIVIGSADRKAAERVADLYTNLVAPVVFTDWAGAELVTLMTHATQ